MKKELIDEELKKLETAGFDFKQINQIALGLKDNFTSMTKLDPSLSIEEIKLYRECAQKYKNVDEERKEVLASYFNKGLCKNLKINDFPNVKEINFIQEIELFFDFLEKLDIKTVKKIYKELQFKTRLKFKDILIEESNYKNFDFNILDNDFASKLLKVTEKEKLEKIFDVFKRIKDSEFDGNSVLTILNNIDKKDYNLLDKINSDSFNVYAKLILNKDFDFKKAVENNIPYFILDYASEVDITILKDKNLKDYISFLENRKINDCGIGLLIKFMRIFGAKNKVLEYFNKKALFLEEVDVYLKFIKHFELCQKYDKNVSKNKFLEKAMFLFEDNYNTEQKMALLKDFYLQFLENDFISEYVTPKFAPNQITFLCTNLIKEKNIKNACDPNFDMQEMKAIIYCNTKNIFLNSKEEYLHTFYKMKNEDYKTFLELHDEIFADESFNYSSTLNQMHFYNDLNKEYNLNLNIEKLLSTNPITKETLNGIIKICKEKDIPLNEVIDENSTENNLRETMDMLISGLDITDIKQKTEKFKDYMLDKLFGER